MKQNAKDLVAQNRQQERDEGMNHSKKKCKALKGKMGAESNLKKDGGPFIPVASKRGKAGRAAAARAETGEVRGSAILSCILELERNHNGHLVVMRKEMLATLEASYEKE